MIFTDWIVNKLGNDKVMHFLGGAWITSLFSPIGWFGILIGVIITMILIFIKEQYLDTEFELKDIIAAGIGCIVSTILYLLLTIFIL